VVHTLPRLKSCISGVTGSVRSIASAGQECAGVFRAADQRHPGEFELTIIRSEARLGQKLANSSAGRVVREL
jgi:hypothetical protein